MLSKPIKTKKLVFSPNSTLPTEKKKKKETKGEVGCDGVKSFYRKAEGKAEVMTSVMPT